MYTPEHFEEHDKENKFALMRSNPLATLVTLGTDGLNANHIPLLLVESPNTLGTLKGHIPRVNPLASGTPDDGEALAIFHGPSGYISPSWYASKREHGKVVPTWNYAVVHAYGKLRVVDDIVWVKSQIEELTTANESQFANPWKVSDAPSDYTGRLLRGLVGIELEISRLIGKNKASQNQPASNRAGVIEGLLSLNSSESDALAALVGDPGLD